MSQKLCLRKNNKICLKGRDGLDQRRFLITVSAQSFARRDATERQSFHAGVAGT